MKKVPALERLETVEGRDAADMRALAGQLSADADFDAEKLSESMRSGTTRVYVLRRRGRIIASASAVRYRIPTGAHWRIEDVVVDCRRRGEGLGRLLMELLVETLRREGATSADLTSRPSRTAANALYRSLGFRRRATNVYRLEIS